jgi:hypothetical protein
MVLRLFAGCGALASLLLFGAPAVADEGGASPPVKLGEPRVHPQIQERLRLVKTVGVLLAKVNVFEIGAGGQRLPRDDWSALAQKAVAESVLAGIEAHGFTARLLEPLPEAQDELLDLRLLYDAVGSSVVYAVYQQKFRAKVERFEYSLGDLSSLLDRYGVDALAIVHGSDENSSGGRKAAQAVTSTALALLGVLAVPRGGVTWLTVGLVDRSGSVLWFNFDSGSYDLRDPGSAGQFVSGLLQQLPAASPP